MIKETRAFIPTEMENLVGICNGKRPDLCVQFQHSVNDIININRSQIKEQIKFVLECDAHYFAGEFELLPKIYDIELTNWLFRRGINIQERCYRPHISIQLGQCCTEKAFSCTSCKDFITVVSFSFHFIILYRVKHSANWFTMCPVKNKYLQKKRI